MSRLYWMDSPEKKDFAWAIERINRCEEQIAEVALQLSGMGVDSVLDLGFTLREHRETWRARAKAAAIPAELHVLDLPAELRWRRVIERNTGTSVSYSFEVTREIFDFMEARWELPDSAECEDYSLSAFINQ